MSKKRRQLYDIECFVHRVTNKAALLSPASDVYSTLQAWFPVSEIAFESDDFVSELVDTKVFVAIPEWLIYEKGWEHYV